MKNKISYLILLLVLFSNTHILAQDNFFFGQYLTQIYSPEEYNAHSQVWCVEQDSRGIIFLGTTSNMVSLDGSTWQLHEMPENEIVRSIDIDNDGKIFIGSSNEFGYFETDSIGKYKYFSLSDKLPDEDKQFQDIWQCYVFTENVYFVSRKQTFIYNKKDKTILKKINPKRLNPGFAFKIGDSLILRGIKKKLFVLKDTTFKEILETKDELKKKGHFYLCEHNSDEFVLLTSYDGIHIFNNKTQEFTKIPLKPEVEKYLSVSIAKKIRKIDEGIFAIQTIKGGVVIIDILGNLINTITDKKGLPSGSIYNIFVDSDKNLWISGEKGVTRVDVSYPMMCYSKNQGVNSMPLDLLLFNETIYIATLNECYYLKPHNIKTNNTDNHTVGTLPEEIYGTWDLLKINQNLTSFGYYGMAQIIDTTVSIIYLNDFVYCANYDAKYQDKLFLGKKNGLEILQIVKNEPNKLIEVKKHHAFDEITDEVRKIVIDKDGNLWLSTYYNGIIFVRFLNEELTEYQISRYSLTHNLPFLKHNRAYLFNNEVKILTQRGIYKPVFPDSNQPDSLCTFVHDNIFKNNINHDSTNIYDYIKLKNGAFILVADTSGLLTMRKDTTIWEADLFKRMPDRYFNYINDRYISITSNTYFYFFDLEKKRNYKQDFDVLIRKITINNDSVIFSGNFYKEIDGEKFIQEQQPVNSYQLLKYNENSIILNFSAIFYEDHDKTVYSYRLEGFDEKWSEYNEETKAVFTNLHEGKYSFAVKAKNVFDNTSKISYYEFKILPPWYRTWWSYIIYVVLAILLILIIVKLSLRRVVKAKIRLKKIVKKRTFEILQQKEELQAQAEELLVTNQELEKLSIVASETNNAIVIMDNEGNFEWGNDGFSNLYGYSFYEFIKKYPNMLSASSNPEIKQKIKNCINNKKPVIYESITEAKSGEKIWVQTTLTPILDDFGNINKIIAIDSDIRKLKEIESELELKNEHITGSIRYAKTIQTGILPFGKMIDKHYENFILFRPKDIVSGDFYWFAEVETENLTGLQDLSGLASVTFIAAVDCTGHGVPGAFMSMIGSSLLNQIVYNEKEYDTAKILTKLNELVIFSLRQDQTDNNDGMDVCLCRIEKQEKSAKIQFTGAKRPLFYIKKGNSKIERLKGDRKSIGGTQKKRNEVDFCTQELELEMSSTIYLSTDGFIDQNDPDRKKYGTAKLISILENIYKKDLKKQHEILNTEIETWMAGTEQRDDITLLGIKIL